MTSQLVVLLDGHEIGIVKYQSGRLSFTYSERWIGDPNTYPLSLSMPLSADRHPHSVIEPFLWGLLPDNDRVLESWGQRYHVSPKNVFRLIAHVGEDCAGAVQLVTPERFDRVIESTTRREVKWLRKSEVAERLRDVRLDPSAGRLARDAGQFSLAGAQPKTALLFEHNRWGVPSGRVPTTHILKPPTGQFDGHAENEHFSLQLARAVGLSVPNSRIEHFGDEIAIVVQRYDRVLKEHIWSRIHQEDICQAIGLHPAHKYEADGGPRASQIAQLLRNQSSAPQENVESFAEALAFNWLIAGTDAHAKNYSLLLGPQGGVRLAPFYDLASALPYHDLDFRKLKLAMKIGGEYLVWKIGTSQWEKCAGELRLDRDALLGRVLLMAMQLPDEATTVLNQMKGEGMAHATVTRLAEQLKTRAVACQKLIRF